MKSREWCAATGAFACVNTDRSAAFGAGPADFFVFEEFFQADFLYILQIFNHAHEIFRSIAFIQTIDFRAGKAIAGKAKGERVFCEGFTGFYFARDS